jgi:hypothetical protein
MGGNGAPATYPGVMAMGFTPPYDVIPAAGGGGCVTDGPFKKCILHSLVLQIQANISQHDY